MLAFKQITQTDITSTMLDTFQRYQATNKVLVNNSGSLVESEDTFEDDWSVNRKRDIVHHFREVIDHGGAVILANEETTVVGFAVIEPGDFGTQCRYRELSYIHVSAECRGVGIGKELFKKAIDVARELGTDKLYIGAHPAIETQHFYSSMGCVLAKEINEKIYLREPRDIQLEITIGGQAHA